MEAASLPGLAGSHAGAGPGTFAETTIRADGDVRFLDRSRIVRLTDGRDLLL